MSSAGTRWPGVVRDGVRYGVAEHVAYIDPTADPAASAEAGLPASSEPPADPATDHTDDPVDELYLLGERCAETYMQADALHYQAMVLLAEFDERKGYEDAGFPNTADWLAWRVGIQINAARERVRTALALRKLPQTSAAMENGELSYTKVRALTRVAKPENEEDLLEFARAGSAANLERMVRGWKELDRSSEITAEEMRHRRRRFSAFVDGDGMVVVRGRLDPELGALLMRAIEQAGDVLFNEDAEVEPEHRRADAVGLICSAAMKAGFGEAKSGSKAERYQVVLHVEPDTLSPDKEPGMSELADGTRVSAETSRRIACDCSVVQVTKGDSGSVLDVGRRTRTIPPSLRRALEARDRGCRFPGCGVRYTDGHHVVHWAEGGETSLKNVMLLCPRHHRAVHEGGTKVCMDRDRNVVFFEKNGRTLFDAPRPVAAEDTAQTLPRKLSGRPDPADPSQTLPQKSSDQPDPADPPQTLPQKLSSPRASGDPAPTLPRKLPRSPSPARAHVPPHRLGAARWTRDSDVPYELEAKAWEALDAEG